LFSALSLFCTGAMTVRASTCAITATGLALNFRFAIAIVAHHLASCLATGASSHLLCALHRDFDNLHLKAGWHWHGCLPHIEGLRVESPRRKLASVMGPLPLDLLTPLKERCAFESVSRMLACCQNRNLGTEVVDPVVRNCGNETGQSPP
jgi:hypothetical protein